MAEIITRGTINIATERCKGCELCIPVCKPGVLQMSEDRNTQGMRYPQLLEGCTGCMACALICPDFCFDVYRYDEAVVSESNVNEVKP